MSNNVTPPPAYQAAPLQAASDRWNVLAIVGFIVTFFVSIVGIILGFIALSQIRRTGEKGHGLALAAVILGFVFLVLGIVGGIASAVISTAALNNAGY